MLQYQSIFNEVRRLKNGHETLSDVVDGLKRENDELIARNSIQENGFKIENAHFASLETALEEHVKAQSELYEILDLQEERQRRVRFFGKFPHEGRSNMSFVDRLCIRRDQEVEG